MPVRETYVLRNGKLVPKREAGPVSSDVKRSSLASPMVIRDTMIEGMIHPCTGERIYSKSEFSRITRDNGCIEVGNEPLPAYTPPERDDNIEADIAAAWQEAEQKSEWEKKPEIPEDHPDLRNQSMTILAQPGQSAKELKKKTQLPVRGAISPPTPKTQMDLTPSKI